LKRKKEKQQEQKTYGDRKRKRKRTKKKNGKRKIYNYIQRSKQTSIFSLYVHNFHPLLSHLSHSHCVTAVYVCLFRNFLLMHKYNEDETQTIKQNISNKTTPWIFWRF